MPLKCSRNHARNKHTHIPQTHYETLRNKSKDIPSQIKMIYCMVKISCISHFIDNLHAFDRCRTKINVNQRNAETKRFKILDSHYPPQKQSKNKILHPEKYVN